MRLYSFDIGVLLVRDIATGARISCNIPDKSEHLLGVWQGRDASPRRALYFIESAVVIFSG